MIYVTQLIYTMPGKEELFHQFEDQAIALMKEYSGQIIQRIRPTADSFVDGEENKPYEIHIVSFESEWKLIQFSRDSRREKFIHLKEQSVASVLMFKGEKL